MKTKIISIRKDVVVNGHEKLFNITLRHTFKYMNSTFIASFFLSFVLVFKLVFEKNVNAMISDTNSRKTAAITKEQKKTI